MLLFAMLLSPFRSVAADEDIYLIAGYDQNGIVLLKQSEGNVVIPGHAFCLDAKAHTPSHTDPNGNEVQYTRVALSELTSYTTWVNGVEENREFETKQKARLLKVIMAKDQLEKIVKNDATFKSNAVAARDKLFDVSSGDASGEVDYVDPVTNEHIKGTIQKTKESMKSSWDDSEMYMKVAQRIPCI